MGRIIINNTSGLPDKDVLGLVKTVVERGQISIGAREQRHYTWATIFQLLSGDYVVSVTPKYKTKSDIFYVYKQPKPSHSLKRGKK